MAKTFFEISKQECLFLYHELVANCERHFRIAQLLADNDEYGTAISHRVLGAEELVKAMIIYFDGIGLNLRRVSGISKLFRDHKTRHAITFNFVLMATTLKPMLEIVERIRVYLHFPDSRINLNELENAIILNDQNIVEQTAKLFGETLVSKIENQLDFWFAADDYKMKGFYVDFKTTLQSPGQISKLEYKNAFDATELFHKECFELISYTKSLSDIDRKSFVDTINKSKLFYNMIEQFFTN